MIHAIAVILIWSSLPPDPAARSSLHPADREQNALLVSLGSSFSPPAGNQERADLDRLLNKISATPPADRQDALLTRIRLLLASANLRLSYDTEPAASRFLLGLHTVDDLRTWHDQTALALEDLHRARETFEKLPEPANEDEAAEYDRLDQNFDLLQSFARMFQALADPDTQDTAALTGALGDVAAYLEADDDRLAETAALWQAVAMRRLGRPDRAADLLSLPLSTPGTSPIDFFTRLERLACLADRGDLEAAMVLALRMEEACTRWYQDRDRQDEARRALLWVRLGFLKRYLQQSEGRRSAEHSPEWQRLIPRLREALSDQDGPATTARLGRTMPLLVDVQQAVQAAEDLHTEVLFVPSTQPGPTPGPTAESAPALQPPIDDQPPPTPQTPDEGPGTDSGPAQTPTSPR